MSIICHNEFGRLLNRIRFGLLCTGGEVDKFLDVNYFEEYLYKEIMDSQSVFIDAANDYFKSHHLPYEAFQGIEQVLIRRKVAN